MEETPKIENGVQNATEPVEKNIKENDAKEEEKMETEEVEKKEQPETDSDTSVSIPNYTFSRSFKIEL